MIFRLAQDPSLKSKNYMKPKTLTICILLGIIAIVSLARIVLSSAFAVDGIALDQTQKQIAVLEKENMLLREKVYALGSYTEISSQAASLGFVEEKSQIAIGNNQALAIRQ